MDNRIKLEDEIINKIHRYKVKTGLTPKYLYLGRSEIDLLLTIMNKCYTTWKGVPVKQAFGLDLMIVEVDSHIGVGA